MPISSLSPADLRLTIDPDSLEFSDSSELLQYPLPWIGQERAEMAARFGLGMDQSDYNLFVLGEVGSGRSSLLHQTMVAAAANRATPPDLCYLHNFDAPERPLALRLPAGQGRLLRQLLARLIKSLLMEIPQRLDGQDFKVESERIRKAYKAEEAKAYTELTAFAELHNFTIHREAGHIVFTLLGEKGRILTEDEMLTLPKAHRVEIEQAEQELHAEITRYFEKIRPMERVMNEALAVLQRQVVKPLLENELQEIRVGLKKQIKDSVKLGSYLEQVMQDVLGNLELFKVSDTDEESRQEELERVMSRYRINLVVDNDGLSGAPVIVEDNPLFRSLFGSIEYQSENDVLATDFTRIRAGSLLKAHGGFLMLHLRDLLADALVWEKLRRLLRSDRLQIEEPGTAFTPITAVSLVPEAVDVKVKIVLIGSRQEYYDLQEADPEFACRFRVKVDFAESFLASAETHRASAIFVAHTCRELGLPHFSAAAVARLLEYSHRQVDDQLRQSAIFARAEALVMESAALCHAHAGYLVEAADVEAALRARILRHDYPEQRLQESIAEGDMLIALNGEKVGQLNSLTQVDLGDYRFGLPVRVTARTFAGEDGLLNIEREVEMSGPIHDKGVFILQNYLSALFAHVAPLALNASIVFEQEYNGMEGDSASCAELYVLLSSLSALPLRQGIAVTGAVNQHGEVLPVGGINEKIEGYFRVCETAGLDGSHGVLIPNRNRRHLMLEHKIVEAVAKNLFHIYTAEHVSEGVQLLTGFPTGIADETGNYRHDSILGRAQQALLAYRRACQESQHPKVKRKRF
ncbi:Lon protease family protein [Nitrosospira sp. Nsp13]|uniref:Lon protease family protein n=1 Tax=Nitrosospira sp. Nsp13 TaxID=1855332 RepID=UPI00087EB656|nr:ATP-binding protein [Nitrosospira sp. Nsp13]SCY31805.1 Predicted ATP-dependent protease [Nitrosospira sp. Nsp13]